MLCEHTYHILNKLFKKIKRKTAKTAIKKIVLENQKSV